MDRERAVAIHEASHVVIGYINWMEIRKASITRTKTNDTEGNTALYYGGEVTPSSVRIHDPLVTMLKGTYARDLAVSRAIMFNTAGYLGEFMFSGQSDFWLSNPKQLFVENPDMKHAFKHAINEHIRKESFELNCDITSAYLAGAWGMVNMIADKLIQDKTLYGSPDEFANMKKERMLPNHKANPLIKFILDQIYDED